MKIKLQKIICKRCGWEWTPRKPEVMVCPKCHSPYFDKEKKHGEKNRPEWKKIW
jgi:Zn finger protein HypA/HybF involved in hydrogenase expression